MKNTATILLIILLLSGLQACTSGQGGKVTEESAKLSQQRLSQAIDQFRKQQLPEARVVIADSIKLNPKNAQAHHVAALIAQRSGEQTQARQFFSSALMLAPNNPGILNNYGNFLCASGNYQAAEDSFNRAATQTDNTTPAIAYTNSGLCALKSGDTNRAKSAFDRAVQIDPSQPTALFQLARLNLESGKTLVASTLMEQYDQHGKETSKTLLLRARIEHALGNSSNMEQYKQQLAADFPDSAEARKAKNLQADSAYQADRIVSPAGNESDTDWLLSREPSHYTLQVVATEDENTIQHVLKTTQLASAAHKYNFMSNGKTWYNLVVGDYSNLDAARRELETLPASLKQYNPWIRRFDSIQRVISNKGL